MKRFSIARLMVVVLVCGVAVAALRNASDLWAGVMLLLTLAVLGASILGILHRRGVERAYWQGFALFGWGYLVLTAAPWFVEFVYPALPTTQLLTRAHAWLAPGATTTVTFTGTPGGETVVSGDVVLFGGAGQPGNVAWKEVVEAVEASPKGGRWLFTTSNNREEFVRVGSYLFVPLAGLVGGMLGQWFHRTNRKGAEG